MPKRHKTNGSWYIELMINGMIWWTKQNINIVDWYIYSICCENVIYIRLMIGKMLVGEC